MNQKRLDLLRNAPVKSAILKLALPMMMAMAMQIIYNMTDTFFIGQTGDENLVAAISLVTPFFLGIQGLGNIFGVGAASYISRKLGEKDMTEAKHACSVAFYTTAALGLFVTAAMLIFKDPLLGVIGTSLDTLAPTSEYLTIIGTYAVVMVLQVSMAGLVRSEGATGKAMIGMSIGIAVNIVLDPIFILTLKMGVAGAAWATVIGNTVSLIFFVIHFVTKGTVLSIRPNDYKPNKRIYGESLKIGIPAGLGALIMCASMMLSNIFAAMYGDHVVAGNGVQMRIMSMGIMLMLGLAQGYQPFAGYNYGAKNYDRLIKGLKTTMFFGLILGIVFTGIFFLFGRDIIGVFINDQPTIDAGTKIMHAMIWGLWTIGFQMAITVTFQATGRAFRALLVTMGRQLIAYVPLLYILNNLFGFDGFIYAQPIADLITLGLAVALSVSFFKHLRERHESQIVDLNRSPGSIEGTS